MCAAAQPRARLHQLGQHEGQRRRGHLAFVQAEMHAAIAEHAVAVRPGIAGGQLRESQPLVELHRGGNVGGRNGELEKTAEHRVPGSMCSGAQAQSARARAGSSLRKRARVIAAGVECRQRSRSARRRRARKISRPLSAISSSVSRQSAAKPGQMTVTARMPRRGSSARVSVGGGREPAIGAEARLEARLQSCGSRSSAAASCAAVCAALIGIAIAARHVRTAGCRERTSAGGRRVRAGASDRSRLAASAAM